MHFVHRMVWSWTVWIKDNNLVVKGLKDWTILVNKLWCSYSVRQTTKSVSYPGVNFIKLGCSAQIIEIDSSIHLGPTPTPNFLRSFLLAQKLGARGVGRKNSLWNWPMGSVLPSKKLSKFWPNFKFEENNTWFYKLCSYQKYPEMFLKKFVLLAALKNLARNFFDFSKKIVGSIFFLFFEKIFVNKYIWLVGLSPDLVEVCSPYWRCPWSDISKASLQKIQFWQILTNTVT